MLYLRNLRVHLQERKNRLYESDYRTYDDELRRFLKYLNDNRYTRCLLDVLDANSDVDFEEWVTDESNLEHLRFPVSEEARAKVCYGVMKQSAEAKHGYGAADRGSSFSSAPQVDASLREFTDVLVGPLVNFLQDQIDEQGNVLYLIERFKLSVEWFRRRELFCLYRENTRVGEAVLNQQLRASLFEGGVDYPFSQPSSPSGQADVVASLGSDDPLVLEIKVFDPFRSKDRSHLRQGFHQVLRYANDYNQSVGYLVIFNCSDGPLVIASGQAPDAEFPPRITYGGKTFFIIPIDLNPDTASASKENPRSRVTIPYKELTGD